MYKSKKKIFCKRYILNGFEMVTVYLCRSSSFVEDIIFFIPKHSVIKFKV